MSGNSLERRNGGHALVDAPKASPVDGMIRSAQDLVSQLTKAQQQFNVIAPVTSTSQLAEGYGATMSVVPIDLTEGSADIYSDNLMKGKVALTKISLMRICAALGISWVDTQRLDNGRERFYWNVRVKGEYRAADGTLQQIVASKEVDFRDGSTQIAGKSPAEISRMRQHGQQLAETKAQLRAVRTLGVKSGYVKAELEKPFLIVRFSFVPDMSNPEVAKMVTAANLGIAGLLYGAPPQAGAGAPDGELPPELGGRPAPKQVGSGQSAPADPPQATTPAAPQEATFDDDEPEADTRPRYRIDHVLARNAAGDWTIVVAGGAQHATNVKEIAKAASEAGKAGKAVTFVTATENGLSRVVELQALDEPAPAGAANDAGAGDAVEGGGAGAEDGLRMIADVHEKAGETNGRKWVKFTIVAVGGESWNTFSKTMADDARHAKANGWKVQLEEKQSEKYPDQMDLVSLTAIDPRQGSLLGGGAEAKY